MSGWTTKKLGEVCEILDSRRIPITRKDRKPGHVPYYGATGQVDSVADYIFNERLLLLGEDGADWSAGANSAFIIEGKSWVYNHAHVLRPLDFVSDCWLMYYLNATDLNEWVSGTTVPKLNQRNMCDIPIPIPPLAEQKRIVAKIDAAFEKIDRLKANAEKNLTNAKELFQSALDEAMRPKKGWVEKRLREVCSKIGSGATPRGGKASYCSKGISLIRSMNVYDCAFEYSELAHINDMQAKELANVTIEANDVLINITGASVARCCVVPSDVMPARVNQHVAILRIADNRFLNPDFLCYSLVAPARKSLLLGIGEAGSTRQALTKTDLALFKIKIPDVFEQKRIVERVKVVAQANEALQQNYAQQVADCAEMRQAILREAFGGRL